MGLTTPTLEKLKKIGNSIKNWLHKNFYFPFSVHILFYIGHQQWQQTASHISRWSEPRPRDANSNCCSQQQFHTAGDGLIIFCDSNRGQWRDTAVVNVVGQSVSMADQQQQ